jgi:hypothetical protein
MEERKTRETKRIFKFLKAGILSLGKLYICGGGGGRGEKETVYLVNGGEYKVKLVIHFRA